MKFITEITYVIYNVKIIYNMGLLFLALGIFIGYKISSTITINSWKQKLLYSVVFPTLVLIAIIVVLAIIYQNGYLVGSKSFSFIITYLAAVLTMLFKINVVKTDSVSMSETSNLICNLSDSEDSIDTIMDKTQIEEIDDNNINILEELNTHEENETNNETIENIITDVSTCKEEQIPPIKTKLGKKHYVIILCATAIILLFGIVIYTFIYHKTPDEKYRLCMTLWNDEEKYEEAITILNDLVYNDNYIRAKRSLGSLYLNGTVVDKNVDLGLKLLEEAAEENDTSACLILGDYYMKEKHTCKSEAIYIKAYNLGCKKASLSLSILYQKPIPDSDYVVFNKEKAIQYAKEAVTNGYYYGCEILGEIFLESETNYTDYDKAFYWLSKGAEYGIGDCYANLGYLYYYGFGVEEDNCKAYNYFKKALGIDAEDDYCLNKIGEMYENGYYLQNNIDSAMFYYKKSADLGNEEAQINYARIIK